MNPKARAELVGIGALVVGLFLGLTLVPYHLTGGLGRSIGAALWSTFGVGAVVIPLLGIGWALAAFERLGAVTWARAAAFGTGLVVLVPYAVGVVGAAARTIDVANLPADHTLWTAGQRLVGLVPAFFASALLGAVGSAGSVLAGLFAFSALGIATVGWHPLVILRAEKGREKGESEEGGEGEERGARRRRIAKSAAPALEPVEPPPERAAAEPRESRRPKRAAKPAAAPRAATEAAAGALLPPIDLLAEPPREAADVGLAQIDEMGEHLIQTLETFRVSGRIVNRTVGPVVTRFEIEPGPGVKVNRIAGLADDLALAMRAQSLRILAPIPGKAAIGIEVPNPSPRMVWVRELIGGEEFRRADGQLPVVLGRDIEGDEVVADLARMPHLLIAGQTGSGKSVCINTIVTSLVYSHPPERLTLLMVDPKMVELSMYGDLPHLGLPVVTNHHKAAGVFKWAVWEMDRRYTLFHANHARSIVDFNKKVEAGTPLKGPRETLATQAGVQKELPFEEGAYRGGVLPYIVLIVDELADLMLTVQGEIETPLASLAQKARAVGVHLILATQRPSVNVITGVIKANFPCRIAFRVASKVDSRTILDQNGAESLLGNGDMLFLPPGKSEPVRVQGAYISTEETERLMQWYRDRKPAAEAAGPSAIETQVEALRAQEAAESGGEPGEPGERDPLFRQAAEVCIQNNLGSTSLLQRRMSIGYGRAARIIDQLEQAGVLGPPNGSKPRDVLVGIEELDEICGPA